MRWLIAGVLLALLVGCGGTSRFTQTDVDEFFDWCVDHRGSYFDCGFALDEMGYFTDQKTVDSYGLDTDCFTSALRRRAVDPMTDLGWFWTKASCWSPAMADLAARFRGCPEGWEGLNSLFVNYRGTKSEALKTIRSCAAPLPPATTAVPAATTAAP